MRRTITFTMLAWLAVAAVAATVPGEAMQNVNAATKVDRLDADTKALEIWLEQFRAEMEAATECRKFWHEVAR